MRCSVNCLRVLRHAGGRLLRGDGRLTAHESWCDRRTTLGPLVTGTWPLETIGGLPPVVVFLVAFLGTLVFRRGTSDETGTPSLWIRNADGSGDPVLLSGSTGGHAYPFDWSPHGDVIAYVDAAVHAQTRFISAY